MSHGQRSRRATRKCWCAVKQWGNESAARPLMMARELTERANGDQEDASICLVSLCGVQTPNCAVSIPCVAAKFWVGSVRVRLRNFGLLLWTRFHLRFGRGISVAWRSAGSGSPTNSRTSFSCLPQSMDGVCKSGGWGEGDGGAEATKARMVVGVGLD